MHNLVVWDVSLSLWKSTLDQSLASSCSTVVLAFLGGGTCTLFDFAADSPLYVTSAKTRSSGGLPTVRELLARPPGLTTPPSVSRRADERVRRPMLVVPNFAGRLLPSREGGMFRRCCLGALPACCFVGPVG